MPLPHRDLPAELAARAFTVEAARMRGLSRSRLSEPDLSVPFKGVRALASAPPTALRLIEAFGLRRPADHIVSHTSALALWGAPLPRRVEKQQRIHVSSLDGITPRANRTIGHTLDPERTLVVTLGELLVTSPATSWVLSTSLLSLDDLIAVGDYLITGTEPFDGRPPLTTLDELHAAVDSHAGARGIRRAREALEWVRYGPLSRRESGSRLMMVRAGLPEPAPNYTVRAPDGRWVWMVDLAHPEFRVATEYESLLHLDPEKFRRDIRKQQELASIGWATHRLTSDDVDPQLRTAASRAAVARIRASLIERGWLPPTP
jgi:hypothetical protein